MKVVCINDNWTCEPDLTNELKPAIGDIDTVTVIGSNGYDEKVFYALERFGTRGFLSTHFVELPEPDADQMQEGEREAIVNLEILTQ